MVNEIDAIALIRGGSALLEVSPVGKGLTTTAKAAYAGVKSAGKISFEAAKVVSKELDESFASGVWNGKLGDEYTYLGNGIFEGKNGGHLINTGQIDPATGNFIFQRVNSNGELYDSYYMVSTVDGRQIRVTKPEALKQNTKKTPEANKSVKSDLHRPNLRKETKEDIAKRQGLVKQSDGSYINPETGLIIREPQFGHIAGRENNVILKVATEEGLTQQQLIDLVNTKPEWFEIQEKNYNLSHAGEKRTPEDYKFIQNAIKQYKGKIKNEK